MNKILLSLKEKFKSIYGSDSNLRYYFAPGRLNLIGEHIDYNGGHVFPYAINKGTFLVVRKRNDNQIRFFSANIKKNSAIYETILSDSKFDKNVSWTNYTKGVVIDILKLGFKLDSGFDALYYGNIPGSGLSSSASMEVATATMINDLYSLNIDKKEIAKLCQRVENNFIGVNCGIMDQFSITFGKKDCAIFLDCATLDYTYAPLLLNDYVIIATNSNVHHSLASSKYNDRRKECNDALSSLQKVTKINHLCDLSIEEFEKYQDSIIDDIARKRAFFAVKEETRTKKALEVLQNNDIKSFAQLINESGDGLRYEYEATCKEIDILVDTSRKFQHCLGARITGGGWGGNIIAIVHKDYTSEYINQLRTTYYKETTLNCESNILGCSSGARRLQDD